MQHRNDAAALISNPINSDQFYATQIFDTGDSHVPKTEKKEVA
jgi:hypothetical protein